MRQEPTHVLVQLMAVMEKNMQMKTDRSRQDQGAESSAARAAT